MKRSLTLDSGSFNTHLSWVQTCPFRRGICLTLRIVMPIVILSSHVHINISIVSLCTQPTVLDILTLQLRLSTLLCFGYWLLYVFNYKRVIILQFRGHENHISCLAHHDNHLIWDCDFAPVLDSPLDWIVVWSWYLYVLYILCYTSSRLSKFLIRF